MTAFFARTPAEQPMRTYFARPDTHPLLLVEANKQLEVNNSDSDLSETEQEAE